MKTTPPPPLRVLKAKMISVRGMAVEMSVN